MTSRRVIITIEVNTDVKLSDLRNLRVVDVNVKSLGGMFRLDVLQSQANVMQQAKPAKRATGRRAVG